MRKLSEQSLSNVALFYLRRYSATRKGLVQVLERKVKRLLREKGGDLDGARALIDTVVARMVADGYVDDARTATAKAASLHRQGKSSRVIQLKLREKGIEPGLAAKSAVSTPERELEAACTLVRRKRLGLDSSRKQKDLAVLLRAGFSHETARQAMQSAEVPPPAEPTNVIRLPLPAAREPDPIEAASALVKKKRLGIDPARKQKDLAVLMRAGFRFDVAQRALAHD